jgi:tetratricopeptide (TPR) repeat protein
MTVFIRFSAALLCYNFLFCFMLLPSINASDLTSGQKAFFEDDYQTALNHLGKALEAKPNNSMLRFFVGQCHFKLEQYAAAKLHFEKALEIKSDYRLARLALARTCLAMQDTSCSLTNYSIIEKYYPSELKKEDKLALVFLRKGTSPTLENQEQLQSSVIPTSTKVPESQSIPQPQNLRLQHPKRMRKKFLP